MVNQRAMRTPHVDYQGPEDQKRRESTSAWLFKVMTAATQEVGTLPEVGGGEA